MIAFLLVIAAQVAPVAPVAPVVTGKPPKAAVTRATVLVDDRAVTDQAPPAVIAKLAAEINRRVALRAQLLSGARKALDDKADNALSSCGDDAGCLATAARDVGATWVVTARVTRREGAVFVALTLVNALRPQRTEDAATLVGSDAEAVAFVTAGVEELFPGSELQPP